MKIKTHIDHGSNKEDLEIASAQMGLYSYMLGHLQQHMPESAFLVCRDRVAAPFRVEIKSLLNTALNPPLNQLRDQWTDIRVSGAKYTPWTHAAVEINLACDSEEWDAAKKIIAKEKTPGGDPTQVVKIGLGQKKALASLGFPSLDSLLAVEPADIPFNEVKGIGKGKTAALLRTILEANRMGKPVLPPKSRASAEEI